MCTTSFSLHPLCSSNLLPIPSKSAPTVLLICSQSKWSPFRGKFIFKFIYSKWSAWSDLKRSLTDFVGSFLLHIIHKMISTPRSGETVKIVFGPKWYMIWYIIQLWEFIGKERKKCDEWTDGRMDKQTDERSGIVTSWAAHRSQKSKQSAIL